MNAQLLVMYPTPKDPKAFDRAYREEHLPFAGPRLKSATAIATKRVATPPGESSKFHTVSVVTFPSLEALQSTAASVNGKEALAHAASISTGGPPLFLVVTDDVATG